MHSFNRHYTLEDTKGYVTYARAEKKLMKELPLDMKHRPTTMIMATKAGRFVPMCIMAGEGERAANANAAVFRGISVFN